ncbi:MAG: metallophosphoesterase [Bacilli bacterium]|nr:metallophosphoesterase [Bacilli bacterium]
MRDGIYIDTDLIEGTYNDTKKAYKLLTTNNILDIVSSIGKMEIIKELSSYKYLKNFKSEIDDLITKAERVKDKCKNLASSSTKIANFSGFSFSGLENMKMLKDTIYQKSSTTETKTITETKKQVVEKQEIIENTNPNYHNNLDAYMEGIKKDLGLEQLEKEMNIEINSAKELLSVLRLLKENFANDKTEKAQLESVIRQLDGYSKIDEFEKKYTTQGGYSGNEQLNDTTKIAQKQENIPQIEGTESIEKAYIEYKSFKDYLSEDQQHIMAYIYKTEGEAKAYEYYRLLQDQINQLKGMEKAVDEYKKIKEAGKNAGKTTTTSSFESIFGGSAYGSSSNYYSAKKTSQEYMTEYTHSVIKGTVNGVEGFKESWENINNGNATELDYERMYLIEALQNDKDLAKGLEEAYGFGESVGNMLPTVTAGTIISVSTGGAGAPVAAKLLQTAVTSSMIFGSSYGSKKHQNLLSGYTEEDAKKSAVVSSLSETLLEEALGSLPGVGKKSTNMLLNMFKEGGQEAIQQFAERLGDKWILDQDMEGWLDDSAKAFIYGALISATFEAGQTVIYNGVKVVINSETLQKLKKAVNSKNEAKVQEVLKGIVEGKENSNNETNTNTNVKVENKTNTLSKVDIETYKDINKTLNSKIKLLKSIGGLALAYPGIAFRFAYTKLGNNTSLVNKCTKEGIYHITSEENANKIISSKNIKASNAATSFGSKKTFFFSGIPTVENVALNLDDIPAKVTAIKTKPTVQDLQSDNFKYRIDDKAITYKGDYNLEGKKVEKAYLCLFEENGKLEYKEVSKDFYNNYNQKIKSSKVKASALGIQSYVDMFKENSQNLINKAMNNIEKLVSNNLEVIGKEYKVEGEAKPFTFTKEGFKNLATRIKNVTTSDTGGYFNPNINPYEVYEKDSFVVVSDFHGADWVMDKIKGHYINEYETIFNLGDITDRGNQPFQLLLDYMELSKQNPNRIVYIPGNHDSFIYGTYMATDEQQRSKYKETLIKNGGAETYKQLENLRKNNPNKFKELMGWLGSQPLQRIHQYGNKKYALAHAFFNKTIYNKNPNYSLKDYMKDVNYPKDIRSKEANILWFRKNNQIHGHYDVEDLPSSDYTMVIGHTANANNLGLRNVDVICVDGAAHKKDQQTGSYSTRKFDGGTGPVVTVAEEHVDTSKKNNQGQNNSSINNEIYNSAVNFVNMGQHEDAIDLIKETKDQQLITSINLQVYDVAMNQLRQGNIKKALSIVSLTNNQDFINSINNEVYNSAVNFVNMGQYKNAIDLVKETNNSNMIYNISRIIYQKMNTNKKYMDK